MTKKTRLCSLVLLSMTTLSSFGWGQKGHDTVCAIAENHLTAATRTAIDSLLDGKSIVYYANWLDNASNTDQYRYSKTWHYKNVDADQTFESAPLLENGDIVRALTAQANILNDPKASKEQKSLALKMVIHFLGDIHQPMHLGRASDRGGNNHQVKYFNSPTNLHTVWDSRLPESAHKWSYSEWVDQIDRATPAQQAEIIKDGTPEKWAKECHDIAVVIYDKTPQDSNLSYDYIAEWTPTIENQFLKGGLRLADLLNSIYDPSYRGSNLIIKK